MIFSVLILTCYRCHNNCGLPVWGQQEQGQLQKISREGKIEALSTRWLTTIENISNWVYQDIKFSMTFLCGFIKF